jgi:hypothetical protein
MYITMPYRFASKEDLDKLIEKAKTETLDSLYRKNKVIWRKFVDGDNFHISISAADEISTYFQEKIGSTHYLFYIGDNDVGKSNNLTKIHYTAYRYTYCFKAFAAERTPDPESAKGFIQRLVVIPCFAGNPPHDI